MRRRIIIIPERVDGRENENHYHSQKRERFLRMRIIIIPARIGGCENENENHSRKDRRL